MAPRENTKNEPESIVVCGRPERRGKEGGRGEEGSGGDDAAEGQIRLYGWVLWREIGRRAANMISLRGDATWGTVAHASARTQAKRRRAALDLRV